MTSQKARVGALCIDSLPFSLGGTLAQAQALRAEGVECVFGYLGIITPSRVGYVLQAGMAFLPVMTADAARDGAQTAARLRALGCPPGTTIHLDLEGKGTLDDGAAKTSASINAWARVVEGEGFNPALYVGVPQPLSSAELWALGVRGYWRGQGSIRDAANVLAEPSRCGWWCTQVYPSQMRGKSTTTPDGVLVDLDIIGQDYLGRVPMWVKT